MKINRKINTYKGKLPKLYAGQPSTTNKKAAFSYISGFPVQLRDLRNDQKLESCRLEMV